jgi:hypothetical protein
MPDTRSTNLKTNLVEYFVQLVQQKSPYLLELESDFSFLEEARKVSLPVTAGELNTLNKEVNEISAMIKEYEQADSFKRKMTVSLIPLSL